MVSRYIVFCLLFSSAFAECPTDIACDANFNKCYKYILEERSYLDAEESCQRFGGHLTSIQNVFENELIKSTSQSMFNGFLNYWVGGNQLLQSTWTWTDGSTWSYTKWNPGFPNNEKALVVFLNNGSWLSISPDAKKPYVCSFPYANGVSPTPHNVIRTTTPTCTRTPFCDEGWTYYREYCYRVIPQVGNWTTAENYCVLRNSHLVSIHSEQENTFVSELASIGRPYNHGFWIGIHKTQDKWVYTDDTEVDYFFWCAGQPSSTPTDVQNFIVVFPDGINKFVPKCWDDYEDYETDRNFVCKKPHN